MFEAYFDDSTSNIDDQELIVAGYIDNKERWLHFSLLWKMCLNASPKIEYFKMSEAHALRGQFQDWEPHARDSKVRQLADILELFRPLSFTISIKRRDYESHLKGIAPYGFNPHFVCIHSAIMTVCRLLSSHKLSHPIDFIFDKQEGVEIDVQLLCGWFLLSAPKDAARLLQSKPRFLSDKTEIPLQAADLLAWHIRRKREGRLKDTSVLHSIQEFFVPVEITESHLAGWGQAMLNVPGIENVQTKRDWKEMRTTLGTLKLNSFVPPYGTKWRNFRFRVLETVKKYIK
jgi:hypothetical protein